MYTMRAFLIVLVLIGAAVLSNATDKNAQNSFYGKCIRKYFNKEVKLETATVAQIDCMYACFMQRVKWLKVDGSFNEKFLDNQSPQVKTEVMAIVDLCELEAEEQPAPCKFAGCLRRNHIANYFS